MKLFAGEDQQLSVAFTPDDSLSFNDATANVSINILKADPVITWDNPADITFGTALSGTQLNAIADINGSFIYDPAIDTRLSAGDNQQLRVTFTPDDTANYNSVPATVAVNRCKAAGEFRKALPARSSRPSQGEGEFEKLTTSPRTKRFDRGAINDSAASPR